MNQSCLNFDGETFNPELDGKRITRQFDICTRPGFSVVVAEYVNHYGEIRTHVLDWGALIAEINRQ